MLEINKSKLGGKGVFTNYPIKKRAKIFRFSDKLIYIHHKAGCDCKICRRCINIKKNYWLYPKKDSAGWNLNHSCSPNSYVKNKDIVALRNIFKGEEITIDYSTTTIEKEWTMKCSCKYKKCRKRIGSVQSLPLHLFNKFKGKMPKFIENNYRD